MVMEAPRQWPKEVSNYYEPIRVLGKGGFGSVILGRPRKRETEDTPENNGAEQQQQVAIKVVGSKEVTNADLGYAHREIDILQELSHDNIMKLIRHWEPAPEEHLCAAVMVLSYSAGPTVHALVQKGGALGLVFGRVVMAQLVDALAYIHSRAVVHRDIKGDNVIVTGATMQQDEIWDDNPTTSSAGSSSSSDRDWKALRQKWHVTFIDFGFARALTPDDMKRKPPKGDPRDALDASSGSRSLNSSNYSSRSLRRSVSRRFTRQMSALGNKDYAAPEITKKMETIDPSIRDGQDILHTISKNVSYYGLQVDAYALGVLMRYSLTGVPPREDVQEFIAMHNNPLAQIARLLCCASSKKKDGQREPQYRGWDKIPPEVFRLIKGLMHYDPQQRTTIRTARRYPWIDDVLEDTGPDAREVNYLDLVKKAQKSQGVTAEETPEHEA